MATYAIGDIQGCFEPLLQLLEKINFNKTNDRLWFTGDLVNRGPQSLETLRFIYGLKDHIITVLGNHDLTLLAVAYETTAYRPSHHTFEDILKAEDGPRLIEWLRHQPLMHYDEKLGYALSHAGIYPQWDLNLALTLAKEVGSALQGPYYRDYLKEMFGNEPLTWNENLSGYHRFRFIVNSFTRMRFCDPTGALELTIKESASNPPSGYFPWFLIPNRVNTDLKIIFGHWASLMGKSETPNVFALDTGCVWGHSLTALRLEDGELFHTPCDLGEN